MENNNIDDILKDKAFDCMDDKSKQELKELCIKMQGKSVEEALPFLRTGGYQIAERP